MSDSEIAILCASLAPIFFVGLWCAICLFWAVIGWGRLAKEFPARGRPSGRRFKRQTGIVGLEPIRACLTVYSSPEGLYLSVPWLFRPGHPPLFIPWEAVHNAKARRLFWIEWVTFDVGLPRIAIVRLSKKVFEGHEVAV